MDRLFTGLDWLDRQIPEGIPYPSSTLITGPAGAAKPLIGSMIIGAWLEQGGSLIYLLINFDRAYADFLLAHYYPDVEKYKGRILYVDFDPLAESVEKTGTDMLRANLLIPEQLDMILQTAVSTLPSSGPPPLLYGSALNMLLFSKTYGEKIHKKILGIIKNPASTNLFAVTNNLFKKQAEEWERAADNVFYLHGTGIMHLGLKIRKMKGVTFRENEIDVPVSEEELFNIRTEAEKGRRHYIPLIRNI